MKKLLLIFLTFILIGGFSGCKSKDTAKNDSQASPAPAVTAPQPTPQPDGTVPQSLSQLKVMTAFKLQDLAGNEVTEKIFNDYKITIMNVWATT